MQFIGWIIHSFREKKLKQHIIGNGIQCMDGDGNLSAQPGQQVEVSCIAFEVSIISCEISNNNYANINGLKTFDANAFIDCDGMFL